MLYNHSNSVSGSAWPGGFAWFVFGFTELQILHHISSTLGKMTLRIQRDLVGSHFGGPFER
jgi:hypothetical protein